MAEKTKSEPEILEKHCNWIFCFYKTTDVDDDDKQVTNAELQKSYLQGRNTMYQNERRRKYTSLTNTQFLSGIDFWVGEGKYMLFCFKHKLLRGFKENKQLKKFPDTRLTDQHSTNEDTGYCIIVK